MMNLIKGTLGGLVLLGGALTTLFACIAVVGCTWIVMDYIFQTDMASLEVIKRAAIAACVAGAVTFGFAVLFHAADSASKGGK